MTKRAEEGMEEKTVEGNEQRSIEKCSPVGMDKLR
jgi:hypothetical protein